MPSGFALTLLTIRMLNPFAPHKLAYVFERFPSFTQTFCFREVRELANQGLDPALYSIRNPSDEPPQDFPQEYYDKVHYLPQDEELTTQIKALHAAKKIPRAMRHTLMDWTSKRDKHRVYAAAYLGPLLQQADIRHVHVHFAGIGARTAYWLKHFYAISYSFTGHANDIFCVEDDLPVTLEDLIREAAFVATVSDFSVRNLQSRFPTHAAKIHRVYNGIELALWPQQSAPPTHKQIVTVGRYIEKKGFSDLIKACALLSQNNIPFECLIIGEGPLEEELQKEIVSHQLQSQVILTGPKSQSEICTILQNATLFALPCVNEIGGGKDNLPTVIMEAMACGLPVVSTAVAGVPEMVIDQQTGRVVPEHDVPAIADALQNYLTNTTLATDHGRCGRTRAEQTFAIEITTRTLKRLLIRYGKIFPSAAAIANDNTLVSATLRRISTGGGI